LKMASRSDLAKMQVLDLQGRVLLSKSIQSNGLFFEENIDLRDYPSGAYFVSVIENDSIAWAKLIKE
jgi:hypothetical protein